jgi:hypothetical protein
VDYSGPGEAPRYGRERREAEGDDEDEAATDREPARTRRTRTAPVDEAGDSGEATAEEAPAAVEPPEAEQTTATAP